MKAKAKKARSKSSAKTSGAKLVVQPHGGALSAGNPGNVGGTGRPPSLIRQRLRGSFDERIAILEEIADGLIEAPPKERIRAVDILAKYGLGEKTEMTIVSPDVIARINQQIDLVRANPTLCGEPLLKALGDVWR